MTLLAVKHNWPTFHAEIARAFDDPVTTGPLVHDTIDGDHVRIEQHHHAVSHDGAFPASGPSPWWKHRWNAPETPAASGPSAPNSLSLDAKLFARAVREHWHIENRLHWILDVVFHEDLSRL